jgi:hypothetical protein
MELSNVLKLLTVNEEINTKMGNFVGGAFLISWSF